MRIYLAVTAEDHPQAAAPGRWFAHVAYRIGPESALLRRNLPLQTRTGLLSVGDRDAPPIADPEALCGETLRECARRGYEGVVLDFEEPFREDRAAFAAHLGHRLGQTGRRLYLPETYADAAPEAVTLVCTAVSGGSFQAYLEEAVERRGGGDRVALDVQRLRMDFRLPAPDGEGVPLDAEAFDALRQGKAVFFSPDLCARYFTVTRDGEGHFILFDDADTVNRKLALGKRYGVETAFLQWPEVRDIAGDIRGL